MLKREFNGFEERPTLLGFGTMRLPVTGPDTMEIDEKEAEKLIDYAYENGINYFDTAYGYHGGQSETFIGKALSKFPRDSFYLASKMPSWMVETEADVPRIFEEQLKKCRVDYFDFYLVHNITENKLNRIENLKIHSFLKEMKAQGKIRHLGFSFHDTPEVLRQTIERFDWEFAQIQFNWFDWEQQRAKETYEILESNHLPTIVMEPLRGGALVNLSPEAAQILEAANPYISPAAWGLRFAATLPNILCVLSGMSAMEQVQANIKTMDAFHPITNEEQKALEQAVVAFRKSFPIPCTGCRYCTPCPMGVDIPRALAIFNHYQVKQQPFAFLQECNVLGAEKSPMRCVGCRKCEKVCPQKIEVSSWMRQLTSMIQTFEKPDWLKR